MNRFNKILSHKDFKFKISQIEILEKNRIFCRHGLNHLIDTARICYILSLENNLNISKDLIYATALLHDIGRYDEYINGKSHTQVSQDTIQILKDCDYSTEEIQQIVHAIQKHQKQTDSIETLSDILYKADKLSRLCFNCNARNECYWNDNKKNKTLII